MDAEVLPVQKFSYDTMAPAVAAKLYAKAKAIGEHMARGVAAMVDVGRELADVKDQLPHGEWLRWLEAEFHWSEWTARRYIQVWEKLGEQKHRIGKLGASVLYQLAAPETPLEAVEEVLAIAQTEQVTTQRAKEVVAKHRPPKKTTASTGETAEPESRPDPGSAVDLFAVKSRAVALVDIRTELVALRRNLRRLCGDYAKDPDMALAAAALPAAVEELGDIESMITRQALPAGTCPYCHGERATADGECKPCRAGGWATQQMLDARRRG